jgi:hypothetical protein
VWAGGEDGPRVSGGDGESGIARQAEVSCSGEDGERGGSVMSGCGELVNPSAADRFFSC